MKQKMKLSEIMNMEAELHGLVMRKPDGSSEVIFKGLLSQPLPLKVKYHLNRFSKVIEAEKETYKKLHGQIVDEVNPVAEDGSRAEPNEDQQKQIDEKHKELLDQEVEIDSSALKQISLDHFGMLQTEFNYPILLNAIGI